MIKIAEARGLFGSEMGKKKPTGMKIQKKQEKRRHSSAKIKNKKAKVRMFSFDKGRKRERKPSIGIIMMIQIM